jgi:hypothetical protein
MHRRPEILNVLFPTSRAEMLRLLFTAPKKPRYVRELMQLSGLALCTVQEELATLKASGLVTTWSNGYRRFYRANQDHPLFLHLLGLVHGSGRLPGIRISGLRRVRRRGKRKLRPQRPVYPLAPLRPGRRSLWTNS